MFAVGMIMFDNFLRTHSVNTEPTVAYTGMKPRKCTWILMPLELMILNFMNCVNYSLQLVPGVNSQIAL